MDELTERFEQHRPRLRAVAYRMLGSVAEAEDVVQEAWLRFHRADTDEVDNLAAWLTTVVGRLCLNVLRAREQRREEFDVHVPDPVVSYDDGTHPEREAVLADSVGLAMLVVLDTLTPAERLAFVLHDLFAVPFEQIAALVEKSVAATRQLASRARRRVQGQVPTPDPDLSRQRDVVDAFFAAARDGDLDALVAVLDPDVVLRSDGGAGSRLSVTYTGARTVAGQAVTFGRLFPFARPALVNGVAGVVVVADGRPLSVMAFTVTGGRVAAIDVLADSQRLQHVLVLPDQREGDAPAVAVEG